MSSSCYLFNCYLQALAGAIKADCCVSGTYGHAIHGRVHELADMLAEGFPSGSGTGSDAGSGSGTGSISHIDSVFPHTGVTLLMASLYASRPAVAQLLLARGADPRIAGKVSAACYDFAIVNIKKE